MTIFSLTEEATVDGHLKHKILATGMEAGGLFCFVNTLQAVRVFLVADHMA